MTVLVFPLQIVNGQFLTVPQDTFRDRSQRIAAIVNTPAGSLAHDEAFGNTQGELSKGGTDIDILRGDLLAVEPDLTFDVNDDATDRTPGAVADNISIDLPEDA